MVYMGWGCKIRKVIKGTMSYYLPNKYTRYRGWWAGTPRWCRAVPPCSTHPGQRPTRPRVSRTRTPASLSGSSSSRAGWSLSRAGKDTVVKELSRKKWPYLDFVLLVILGHCFTERQEKNGSLCNKVAHPLRFLNFSQFLEWKTIKIN